MAISIEESLASVQAVAEENERLKSEIEQLKRNMEILQEEREEAVKQNEAFQPYADIIMDEDTKKEWKEVAIRSPYVYKQLLVRTRQLFGNTTPMAIASVVQNCLEFALSRGGWSRVVKLKYAYKEGENRG